tara:strand:- start:89 stop:463 length:375 start_codon:yes stop_codon:yes gene_type:complete
MPVITQCTGRTILCGRYHTSLRTDGHGSARIRIHTGFPRDSQHRIRNGYPRLSRTVVALSRPDAGNPGRQNKSVDEPSIPDSHRTTTYYKSLFKLFIKILMGEFRGLAAHSQRQNQPAGRKAIV